jgi:hypothetical protein
MYVCNRGGPRLALALLPFLIYCAFPLISPLLIPHFEWSAGLYLWGRHRSHLVPWKTGPGDEILDKLEPHSHIGRVRLIHLLLGTSTKWDHSSAPIWTGVPLDGSVLCIVPLSISLFNFNRSLVLLAEGPGISSLCGGIVWKWILKIKRVDFSCSGCDPLACCFG